MTPLRKRMMEELQLRNFSPVTARAYLGAAKRFAKYFGRSPKQLGPEHIRQYLLHLLNDNRATPSTVQLYRSALKFLYASRLKRPWFDLEIAGILLILEVIQSPKRGCCVVKAWPIRCVFLIFMRSCSGLRRQAQTQKPPFPAACTHRRDTELT